jgi:hypothetical protein
VTDPGPTDHLQFRYQELLGMIYVLAMGSLFYQEKLMAPYGVGVTMGLDD